MTSTMTSTDDAQFLTTGNDTLHKRTSVLLGETHCCFFTPDGIFDELKFAFPLGGKGHLVASPEFRAFFTKTVDETVTNSVTGETTVVEMATKTPVRFYFIALGVDPTIVGSVSGSLNITNRDSTSAYINSSGYFRGLTIHSPVMTINHSNVIIGGDFFRKFSMHRITNSAGETCVCTPTIRTGVCRPISEDQFQKENPNAFVAWAHPECPNKDGYGELIGRRSQLLKLTNLKDCPIAMIQGPSINHINPWNGFNTEHYEDAGAPIDAVTSHDYFEIIHKWISEMTTCEFDVLFAMLEEIPCSDIDVFHREHEEKVSLESYPAFLKLKGKMWYGELLDALFVHQNIGFK